MWRVIGLRARWMPATSTLSSVVGRQTSANGLNQWQRAHVRALVLRSCVSDCSTSPVSHASCSTMRSSSHDHALPIAGTQPGNLDQRQLHLLRKELHQLIKSCCTVQELERLEAIGLRSNELFYFRHQGKAQEPGTESYSYRTTIACWHGEPHVRVFRRRSLDSIGLATEDDDFAAMRTLPQQQQQPQQQHGTMAVLNAKGGFFVSEFFLMKELVNAFLMLGEPAKSQLLFKEMVSKLEQRVVAEFELPRVPHGDAFSQSSSLEVVLSQLIPSRTIAVYLLSLRRQNKAQEIVDFVKLYGPHLNAAAWWHADRFRALFAACSDVQDAETIFQVVRHLHQRSSLVLDLRVYQHAILMNLMVHESSARGLANALEMVLWTRDAGYWLAPKTIGTVVLHMAKQKVSHDEIVAWIHAQDIYKPTHLLLFLMPTLLDRYRDMDLCLALLTDVVNRIAKANSETDANANADATADADVDAVQWPTKETGDVLLTYLLPTFLTANPSIHQLEQFLALMTTNGTQLTRNYPFAALVTHFLHQSMQEQATDDDHEDNVQVEVITRHLLALVEAHVDGLENVLYAAAKPLGMFLGEFANQHDVSLVIEVIGTLFLNNRMACHVFIDHLLWKLLERPGQISFLNLLLQVMNSCGIGMNVNKIRGVTRYLLTLRNHATDDEAPKPCEVVGEFIEFTREHAALLRDPSWAMDAALESCIQNQWLAECHTLIESARYRDISVSISTLQQLADLYLRVGAPVEALVDLTEVMIENPCKPINEPSMRSLLQFLLHEGELYPIVNWDCRLRLARRFQGLRGLIAKANRAIERANAYYPEDHELEDDDDEDEQEEVEEEEEKEEELDTRHDGIKLRAQEEHLWLQQVADSFKPVKNK